MKSKQSDKKCYYFQQRPIRVTKFVASTISCQHQLSRRGRKKINIDVNLKYQFIDATFLIEYVSAALQSPEESNGFSGEKPCSEVILNTYFYLEMSENYVRILTKTGSG